MQELMAYKYALLLADTGRGKQNSFLKQ